MSQPSPADRPVPPARRERPVRTARSATVVRVETLTPDMLRVIFTGDDLPALPPLSHTDHYIKILFAPAGADYRWPFDVESIRETQPAPMWPVTRTYTIRSYDRETNEMAVDFVIHGDDGLAGPWAARARPGDQIGFMGPGGAYTPDPSADAHLLVGDESAIPAIAAALERLPSDAIAQVFIEVAAADRLQPLPLTDNTTLTWVYREGSGLGYGAALVDAVQAVTLPTGDVQAFVHGNADMIRPLRSYLFGTRQWDRSRVSISGYWRTGHTEDRWQATKREFNAAMDADQAG